MSVADSIESGIAGVPLAEAVFDAVESIGFGENAFNPVVAGTSIYSACDNAKDFLADPIGSFAASGVGWVIEHVPALKLSLDAVSGDEEAIERTTKTWTDQVAKPLGDVATAIRQAGSDTRDGWTGPDATEYREATARLAVNSEALSAGADAAAVALKGAGSLVIEVRNVIRDELSKLLVWTVATYAAGVAASAPTGGGSVVAATNMILLRASALGQRFAGMLRTLSTKLDDLAQRLSVLGKAAEALRRGATKLDGLATSVTDAVGRNAVANGSGSVASVLSGSLARVTPSTATSVASDLGLGAVKATGDAWGAARET